MVTRKRGKPTKQEIARLAHMDLWSQRELAELCTGWMPGWINMTEADVIAINEAIEVIARGTHAGKLAFVPRDDADGAAIMYNQHRHYVPAVAAEWATSRFPDTFPAGLLAAVREYASASPRPALPIASESTTNGKPIRSDVLRNLLRIIRALYEKAGLPEHGAATEIEQMLQSLGFMTPQHDAISGYLEKARELKTDKPPK